MRVINEAGLDTLDDVETYTIRDTVQALRCDDGVTIADSDGKTVATADGDVVLVIDGDDYTPIPADIFDALYEGRGAQPASADREATEPTPAATTGNGGAADETQLVPPGGDENAAGGPAAGTATEQPTPSVADLSQQ